MKRIAFTLLAMLQLFGCSARDREGLSYFYYENVNQMIRDGVKYWKVELADERTVVVTLKKEGREPVCYSTSPDILTRINGIVNEYRMYRYKGEYRTKLDVRDGFTWSFNLKYADGSTPGAHGFMKYPKGSGEAFSRICELIEKWVVVPDGSKMKSFHYSYSNGMIINYGANYNVSIDGDGKVEIVINEYKDDERRIVTDYLQIFDDLQQIVLRYGMFAYRESYMPEVEIRDGGSWDFGAGYVDGTYIRSGGYVEKPETLNEAQEAIDDYFKPWRTIPLKNGKVPAQEVEQYLAGINKR